MHSSALFLITTFPVKRSKTPLQTRENADDTKRIGFILAVNQVILVLLGGGGIRLKVSALVHKICAWLVRQPFWPLLRHLDVCVCNLLRVVLK